MARKIEKTEVISSTLDDEKAEAKTGTDVVTIAVCLRFNHKFDDVPNGTGGTKTVILEGLDSDLRGESFGILNASGNAKFQTLPRKDWEAILAMHGSEAMFKGLNGHTPSVFEVKRNEIKSDTVNDKVKNSAGGFDPVDPAKLGVTEIKQSN